MIKDKNDKTSMIKKLQTDPIQCSHGSQYITVPLSNYVFCGIEFFFFTHCRHCIIFKYFILLQSMQSTTTPTPQNNTQCK